jgi:light-regulated signal transduction histidine kinase (bacteriophytochrome)
MDFYKFQVENNRLGIDKKYQEKIFNIFEMISNSDRVGKKGTNVDFYTFKKLLEGHGG